MRVRVWLFVVGFGALWSAQGHAQEVVSRTDPKLIKACPGDPPKDFAGTVWHADHVGVSRLIPGMPGSDSVQVFRFFTGPESGDLLTDEQRIALLKARQGIETSVSYLFFTPADTPIEKASPKPPAVFYDQLIDSAQPEHLRQEVLPCGTELPAGLTYGTRLQKINGEDKLVVSALPGPTKIWWYQEGVYTADGQPGVKVSVTTPVFPEDGPYKGFGVEVLVFDICGNISGRVLMTQPATTVTAAVPPPSPPEQPKTLVPPPNTLPPLAPAPPPPDVETVRKKRPWIPCYGKIQTPICAAVIGAFFIPHGSSTPTGPSQPGKTGGPGGR